MHNHALNKLAGLVERERTALLARWREQVRQLPSARHLDTPTLNDHIPGFLTELAGEFRRASEQTIPEAIVENSPPAHGMQRYDDGFDIVEVVAEYNILRGCIHDLAESNDVPLRGQSFHILNRVLDEAIGLAVQTFAIQQALAVQKRREEYLAFVAHDLRTPLNAISLAARVLELSDRDASETEQMLKTLHRNVKRLEGLVDKVLKESAHVQSESGVKLERRQLDLWPLVEGLLHDLRPVADSASTRLVNEVPGELSAFADASLLKRILQNLISNAIKYTPRGQVAIGARETDADGGLECWIRDDGAGIPPERLELVFDKLETDPEKEGGIGLGLAIVKSFVEAHGGKVSVESKPDHGTTFRFTLPGRK